MGFILANVHRGAVALGHPAGCVALRVVVTLFHAVRRLDASLGLAALCGSSRPGIALAFQRE